MLQQGEVGSCQVDGCAEAEVTRNDQGMQPELGVLVQNEHAVRPDDDVLAFPAARLVSIRMGQLQ